MSTKDKFEEKGKKLAKERLQDAVPEAVASVSYSLVSPNDYPLILTMRDSKESALFERMDAIESYLKDAGYLPDKRRGSSGRTEAQKETVEGRECPKCGSPLIYFEAKGKKHIKCSTSKWDYITKTSSGCDFIEWADDGTSPSISGFGSTYSGEAPATPRQVALLREKNLYEDGMSKAEATDLIGKVLGK